MKKRDAYQILGLSAKASPQEIKKRYRQLMMQIHPDANTVSKETCGYTAQDINRAYAVLKSEPLTAQNAALQKEPPANGKTPHAWNAPINKSAYTEREILHYAEDSDGTVIGNFCIATGKYLWTTEEDFPLFLLSIYNCSKQLLDEVDASLGREGAPAIRHQMQTELSYLLAQQFIDATALLKELTKEAPGRKDCRIFYISSMLESSERTVSLRTGEALYPSKIRHHKLYLKNRTGQELGYLSFSDDRLYYVLIPLFEQKRVQVKIQTAKKQPEKTKKYVSGYQNLDMWVRLSDGNFSGMPESLNLQIERLLAQYAGKV